MLKVRVPATSANMGPGFDCMGIALDIYNTVNVYEMPHGLIIENNGRDSGLITADKSNLIYKAIERVFKEVGITPPGLRIVSYNNIPVARGLGSSAAGTAAGLLLANGLIGGELKMEQIIKLGTDLEGHPDNIVPALVGGMTVSYSVDNSTVDYIKLNFPEKLNLLIMVPDISMSTADARRVLPRQVDLKSAVFNVSRAALLVAALTEGRSELLRYAVEDRLHQPYREKLIPGMGEVFKKAYSAGARGVYLSGAGSALVAMVDTDNSEFLADIKEFLNNTPQKWELKYANVSKQGAALI